MKSVIIHVIMMILKKQKYKNQQVEVLGLEIGYFVRSFVTTVVGCVSSRFTRCQR